MSELVDKQRAAVAEMGDTFSPKRDHHVHPPHLAHHFDTPEQQFSSGKLGMWAFLATELLMFGGLFCAYGVYRHNHPEVFMYAHHYLSTFWGAVNTVILISSSFTMAWGVRCAQLGETRKLVILLALTLLGGFGFMIIKGIEYAEKYQHDVWIGAGNMYHKNYHGDHLPQEPPANQPDPTMDLSGQRAEGEPFASPAAEARGAVGGAGMAFEAGRPVPHDPNLPSPAAEGPQRLRRFGPEWIDPHAGTGDEARIRPTQVIPAGLAPDVVHQHEMELAYAQLPEFERDRISTFFSIYFVMTGLHGIHVLVGMGLIAWVLFRAWGGEFGPAYFAPVDLVGLYWHLVDLIWIFLFPLLYLIH